MNNPTKIYFAGSIRGGREDRKFYAFLIEHLKQYGEVLSEHIGQASLSSSGEKENDDRMIHNRDMDWLLEADLIIAEVSTPSLGVGYEIGRAVERNKPILCLYRQSSEKKLSAMIAGSPAVTIETYTELAAACKSIDSFILNLYS